MRRTVEADTGAPCIFFAGALGGMMTPDLVEFSFEECQDMHLPVAKQACEQEAVWLDEAIFRSGTKGVDDAIAAMKKIHANRAALATKVKELSR